jgi:hypothetical protein
MKVLTATNQTQGWRDNDFCCTIEGEMVFFPPLECGRGSVDDDCGCRRSMAGLVSHRATTTITVADREGLDPDTYFMLIADGLRDQGYVTKALMKNPDVNEWLHDLTDELMYMADAFSVATILERRGDVVNVRPNWGVTKPTVPSSLIRDSSSRHEGAGYCRAVTGFDAKGDLHRYLEIGRDVLLWKLEGLSEYDIRRPMVPTGTNLLGLIKHLAAVEVGYFGDTFGRPFDEPPPWFEDDSEPNVDMWATADESRGQIMDLYQRACAHSDATINALPLDAVGHVPWWPDHRSQVTLHQILVHVIAETHRHAGHADVVRELIDGAVGLREGNDNMAPGDREWWEAYRSRLERVAQQAGQK